MGKNVFEDRPLFITYEDQPVYLLELEERGFAMVAAMDLILYTLERLHHDDENVSSQTQNVLMGFEFLVSSMKRDMDMYFIPEPTKTADAFREGFKRVANRLEKRMAES
jgi:hypothetical protein